MNFKGLWWNRTQAVDIFNVNFNCIIFINDVLEKLKNDITSFAVDSTITYSGSDWFEDQNDNYKLNNVNDWLIGNELILS